MRPVGCRDAAARDGAGRLARGRPIPPHPGPLPSESRQAAALKSDQPSRKALWLAGRYTIARSAAAEGRTPKEIRSSKSEARRKSGASWLAMHLACGLSAAKTAPSCWAPAESGSVLM